MSIHFILGGIAMLLGLCFLWLWTRPRFQNRYWLDVLFPSVSLSLLIVGAMAAFPWFKEHVDSLVGILIGLGFGVVIAVFRWAVLHFEKRFRAH